VTVRWWHLRRGVPWTAVLGCCVAAGLLAGLLARWPSAALVLLPGVLACCATATVFLYDEAALPVVAVTPRGGAWRRTTRLTAAALPLGVWGLLVVARPGDLPLDRSGWWLLGGATILLTTGTAALASRREVPSPGATLAGGVVLAVLGLVVVTTFLGWSTVFPVTGFDQAVLTFWLVIGAAGAAVWLGALWPARWSVG
jgi:hypothetical protein